MQQTSALYKDLLSEYQSGYPGVKCETRLSIGETGVLIDRQGNAITFGGVSILVGATGGDGGYDESFLISMETDFRVFSEESPTVGNCVAAEIDIKEPLNK